MRHHGTPTRLLDFTKSPYVAAFFATAEAREDETSAIWAVDVSAIKREAIGILSEAGAIERSPSAGGFSFSQCEVFNTIIMKRTHPAVVVPVQPFKMNERVTSQQGLFLCSNSLFPWGFELGLKQVLKSDLERSKDLTREMLPDDDAGDNSPLPRLLKLVIRPQARCEVLRELYRMNISYATLFPGLDGFALSLKTMRPWATICLTSAVKKLTPGYSSPGDCMRKARSEQGGEPRH